MAEIDELLRYAIPLVAVAVAWGQTRTEVSAMKEAIQKFEKDLQKLDKELDDVHDQFMKRSECRDQHQRNDRVIDEMKADIKDIKRLLIEFMGRPHAS